MKAPELDFDSVYVANFNDVRRFVFHFVQNPTTADELTQDAFLRAHEAWASFRGEAPERIWLLRIARNVCLDYLRSPRARQAVPLDEGLEITAAPGCEPPLTVDQAARQAEMTDCVQRFVLSLPETFRTPLILHDMEGLTNAHIAQVVGVSLEAAKMRLHRARERLRRMMEERCDLFYDERNVLSCLPMGPSVTTLDP